LGNKKIKPLAELLHKGPQEDSRKSNRLLGPLHLR
jgi:hypothetical protein